MKTQQIKVWGLTKRGAILWLGILGCATGGAGFILLILWWLEYDRRSKQM